MTRAERGRLPWQVLAAAADNRRVLTYSLLADAIGMGPGTLSQVLGCIMHLCQQRGSPPLTVLVMNKETGLPGAVAPCLGHDRRGGDQLTLGPAGEGDQPRDSPIAAVDGDERAGIEDQPHHRVLIGCSSGAHRVLTG